MEPQKNMLPPSPLNGGIYTGTPFHPNAPWRNFPAIPSAPYLTHVNLRTANPPPQALFQLQAGFRPGNNDSDGNIPGVVKFEGDQSFGPFSGMLCMPCLKQVKCSCGFDCPCKEYCRDGKTKKCPCSEFGCPIKYVNID